MLVSRPVLNPGTLVWSGEHWINFLRRPGDDSDSGMVSLYHTHYSAAGEGTVAWVHIRGDGGFTVIYTDNEELVPLIVENMGPRRNPAFDHDLPILAAAFARGGDIRRDPSWTISTDERQIVARWLVSQPPAIAEGPSPVFKQGVDFFTILFFTDEASITVSGRAVDGQPYIRDTWRASIGGDRSSCVFALAETMTAVPRS